MGNVTSYSRILSLLLPLLGIGGGRADEFEYSNQATWYDKFEQCSLHHQSPIELNSKESDLRYDIPSISFDNYNSEQSLRAKIANNGHTVDIQLLRPNSLLANFRPADYNNMMPSITGGPLPDGRFLAESLHFHWGSKDAHGSEHVIDSERFSMEMHIVHRNSKYGTMDQARSHADGLAVLAVIYTVKPEATVTGFSGLESVLRALEDIRDFNATTEISNFKPGTLISDLDRSEFYTYEGSLTTPPCSEAVTWIVFSHVIPISHQQMNRFHKLSDDHGGRLENNYRSLQPKGNRRVTLSKKHKVINSIIKPHIFWINVVEVK